MKEDEDLKFEISDLKTGAATVSRGMFWRAVLGAVVIAMSVGTLWSVEKKFELVLDKPPMPLQQPLSFLSKDLGGSRYVAQGNPVASAPDSTMDDETLETLGTREYLLRRYVDRRAPGDSAMSVLHLNLNYYATGSSTPHVPEICWASAGMVEALDSRQIFEVPDVRRRDGSLVTLRMNMISFLAPGSAPSGVRKYVGYMYAVNGEYVATPKEVVSRFWKARNKHAYDTKIEVTVGDRNQFCTFEEAKGAISDFVRVALPGIEGCLPVDEKPGGGDVTTKDTKGTKTHEGGVVK
jgi:hypothetical protein